MDELTSRLDRLPRGPLARSNGPLYRQLADILRRPIGDGVFPVGSELPKEAAIAEHFGVSLITVRQALRDLAADGLIQKRSAKPAVVVARSPAVSLSWKFSNFADVAAFTRDAELRIKSYRKETAPELGKHFGLAKDEAGYCLRSVLSVGATRKAQITTYFPPDVGARFRKQDFSDVLIFQSVQRLLGVKLAAAHVTIRAEVADDTVAGDLHVQPGSAILAVEMLYRTADERPVEFTVARHPADLFSITYDLVNDLG